MVITLYIIYLLIGVLCGVFMGSIGIGAGLITVPLLNYTGMSLRNAVGCSLLMQLLPQSLPGVFIYHKKGYIDYYPSFTVIFGSLIGITIGAYIIANDLIEKKYVYKILSIILIIFSFIYAKDHLFN